MPRHAEEGTRATWCRPVRRSSSPCSLTSTSTTRALRVRWSASIQDFGCTSRRSARHLVDPSRLRGERERLYGDAFDALWGELAAVPEENVHVVGDDVVGLACFPTPGHASHPSRTSQPTARSYAGDAVGVASFRPVRDSCLAAAGLRSGGLGPHARRDRASPAERLALIHFGVAEDVETHLAMTREELARWVERVEPLGATEQEFVDAARRDIAARVPEDPDSWQRAAPFWRSYRGIERYWTKKRETEAATAP